MRLWTLHPRYLDAAGLVALWREGLLARAVLRGRTRGYRHHPQLERFRSHATPCTAINHYLSAVLAEAVVRGYAFDGRSIRAARGRIAISVSKGQLAHEWQHLLRKLRQRRGEAAGSRERGQPAVLSGDVLPLGVCRYACARRRRPWETGGARALSMS